MIEISVVICTYNRCDSLKDTLQSLAKASEYVDFRWQILVVDNNSEDDTKTVVDEFLQQTTLDVRHVVEKKRGYSFVRNRGIAEADGEIIAFVDDDVIVDPRWLLNLRTCYQQYSCDAVGGRVLPLYPPRTPQWIKDFQHELRGPILMYDYGEEILSFCYEMDSFVTANFSAKKRCFEEIGLFRTDISRGEDEEFSCRLLDKGKTAYYNGRQLVWHKVAKERMTYRYLAKWYFGAGKYTVQVYGSIYKVVGVTPPCWMGVPRHYVKLICLHTLLFLWNIFNKENALRYWELIFRELGMCAEFKNSKKSLVIANIPQK